MPPKGRRQLSGPACDKAAEAYDLIIAFAGQDEELLGETIRALMNCPGVVRALGIPGSSYHDTDAVSSMLAAVRSTFAGRLSTSGSRHAGEREQAQRSKSEEASSGSVAGDDERPQRLWTWHLRFSIIIIPGNSGHSGRNCWEHAACVEHRL